MNIAQKQYENCLQFPFNSQRFNTTKYFEFLDTIKSRPNRYLTNNNYIVKKVFKDPSNNFYVKRDNKFLFLKLNEIENKPVVPKMNNEYIEFEKRLKNNRERMRALNNRALTLENVRFAERVFTQKPTLTRSKILEKLYEENHEKYFNNNKNRRLETENYKSFKLPKIVIRKLGKHKSDTNLNSDYEQQNAVELNDHGHKEISHHKQGHIDGNIA